MPLSVFAEGSGLFHKGSNGTGVALGDVCLTPAPPPAESVPVPYVNTLRAEHLTRGSRSVKVDGFATALESVSCVASSSGDEAGTRGGNVVSHTTRGRGYFKTWSFTVRVEGLGVCRHGDMLGQNSLSTPAGCVSMAALVQGLAPARPRFEPCTKPYRRRRSHEPTAEQSDAVRGGPCWECKRDPTPKLDGTALTRKSDALVQKLGAYLSGWQDARQFVPEHQPPLALAWTLGGCHLAPGAFDAWAAAPNAVRPQCRQHAASRGGALGPALRRGAGRAARDAIEAFLG